ncbi:hypothetical protein PLESTF_000241400 [Pleodorina starrii]|nr:hypothetical protein PLESTF_000241400 [Pleodorina starrii]
MAAVGTIFAIDLWVWDSNGGNASVTRYVQIAEACPAPLDYDTAKYRMCQDLSGRFFATSGDTRVERTLTVYVYARFSTQGIIAPLQQYTNATQAALDAADISATAKLLSAAPLDYISDILETNATEMYTAVVESISRNLSSLFVDVSDIAIRDVWSTTHAGSVAEADTEAEANITTTAISVRVEVFTHFPVQVHEGSLRDYTIYAAALAAHADFLVDELSLKVGFGLRTWWSNAGNNTVAGQTSVAASNPSGASGNGTSAKGHGAGSGLAPSRRRMQQLQAHPGISSPPPAPLGDAWHSLVSNLALDFLGIGSEWNDLETAVGGRQASVISHTESLSWAAVDEHGVEDAAAFTVEKLPKSDETWVQYMKRKLMQQPQMSLPPPHQLPEEPPPMEPQAPWAPDSSQAPPSPPSMVQQIGGLTLTNVTKANLTTSQAPAPGSTIALQLSLRALIAALERKVYANLRGMELVSRSANLTLTAEAQEEGQDEWNERHLTRLPFFLDAQKASINSALNKSKGVLALLERQLSQMEEMRDTMADTAVEMSEQVAQMEAMTARAIYETMVIEEATGQAVYAWINCPGKSFSRPSEASQWVFNIDTYSNFTGLGTGVARRSMLVRSGQRAQSNSTRYGPRYGYGLGYLPVASEKTIEDEFLTGPGLNSSVMIDRRLFRSLHLVGGVMLHSVRWPMDEPCHCDDVRRPFNTLNFDCSRLNTSGACSNATKANPLHPYGIDPVFLSSSSLYDARLSDKVNQYYNTTPESNEVSATGAPYSYFPKRLQGYLDGFPVLMPNSLTDRRVRQLLTYLQDSNFLDRYTRRLTVEMLAFSTELKAFGHVVMTFTWAQDGSVNLGFRFSGLPAFLKPMTNLTGISADNTTTSSSNVNNQQRLSVVAVELAGISALTALFVVVVASQAIRAIRAVWEAKTGSLTTQMVWDRFGNLFLDLVVAGLLLASSAMYAWYMVSQASEFYARQHYQVYDNILTARARWLLPLKTDPWNVTNNSTQTAQWQNLNSAINLTQPKDAGGPGRYLLPDALDDQWDELARVLDATHNIANAWMKYGILQSITCVLIIVRLLSTLAFQGRVGAIVQTLYHAVPPLSHLLVLLVVMGAMLAAMAHVILGTYVGPLSTITGAIDNTIALFLGRGILESMENILPRRIEFTTWQRLAATCVILAQILLLSFMLINFFFSVIIAT